MIKKIIKEHKTTLPKAIIEGLIITLFSYTSGVILIDYMGFRYSVIGLALIPLTFSIKYILCKYWVYRK